MGGASRAVMSKIMAHDGAAQALATTMEQMAQRARRRRDHVRASSAHSGRDVLATDLGAIVSGAKNRPRCVGNGPGRPG